MKSLNQLIQFHKGGSSGGGQAQAAQNTIVSSPPPPTTQSVEVQQAQRQAAKDAAKKRGLKQTILAGETGGYKPGAPAGGTILAGASGEQKASTLGGV
jgi:hypothetical protein